MEYRRRIYTVILTTDCIILQNYIQKEMYECKNCFKIYIKLIDGYFLFRNDIAARKEQ